MSVMNVAVRDGSTRLSEAIARWENEGGAQPDVKEPGRPVVESCTGGKVFVSSLPARAAELRRS